MADSDLPTMRWFGKSWGAQMNIDCPKIDAPTGALCIYCAELIDAEDTGVVYSNGPAAHFECFMRQVVGSIPHQQKLCICYGGNAVEWPGELTYREAARYAVEHAGVRRPGS